MEVSLWAKGFHTIAGVDEAGEGGQKRSCLSVSVCVQTQNKDKRTQTHKKDKRTQTQKKDKRTHTFKCLSRLSVSVCVCLFFVSVFTSVCGARAGACVRACVCVS
jgi:hypothetical protein